MKKVDLIIHPIRLRILTVMVGKEMTTAQLAEALSDVPQATLYRHVKVLADGGVLEVVAKREAHGAVERTYRLTQERSRLSRNDMRDLTADDHVRYFNIFAATLVDAFSRYTHAAAFARTGVGADGASYQNVVVYLSDKEKVHLQKEFERLIGAVIGNPKSPTRKGYLLASVVIPEPQDSKKGSKPS
jgi:DNA-binding transcriptional ArsR family regulator